MIKRALLLALVLVPAAVERGPAQTQAEPARFASSPQPAQPGQARRPAVYTGFDIRFSASVGSDMVVVQAFPVVTVVEPGSPAQQAGIAAGDQIVEVNGADSRGDRVLWLEPNVRYTLRLRTGDQEREVVLVPLPPRAAGT